MIKREMATKKTSEEHETRPQDTAVIIDGEQKKEENRQMDGWTEREERGRYLDYLIE